ncbi:MAG: RNA 2'-phosphotransferase [Actinobacteria bacterium]|nr:RNA 2'-phosphotransferase [Actinomycetota bacterium]
MAYHLRHGERIALLPGGWARIDALLDVLPGRASRDAVTEVVASGDKPRFELSHDGALIRARYGHSRRRIPAVPRGMWLTDVVPPAYLSVGRLSLLTNPCGQPVDNGAAGAPCAHPARLSAHGVTRRPGR